MATGPAEPIFSAYPLITDVSPVLFSIMSVSEKIFSVLGIGYISALAVLLVLSPEARQLKHLLPLSLLGVGVNAGLLFVVFKDIFSRSFPNSGVKYFWIIIIFLFMPAIIFYLPRHGFRKR